VEDRHPSAAGLAVAASATSTRTADLVAYPQGGAAPKAGALGATTIILPKDKPDMADA
jgi:hypothetical protein